MGVSWTIRGGGHKTLHLAVPPLGLAMDLIDLTGRQDEPAVRRVLALSHGSTEALEEASEHYRSGEWTFIGWLEGEDVLACAGAELLGSGTIGICSIAVDPLWRHGGLGRMLLDALAPRGDLARDLGPRP